jgi:hypothetical protein
VSGEVAGVELRAGSIVLRPWRTEDAQVVYEACQDPEIAYRHGRHADHPRA